MSLNRTRIGKSFAYLGIASGLLLGSSLVANSAETTVKTEFQQQTVTFPNGVIALTDVVY